MENRKQSQLASDTQALQLTNSLALAAKAALLRLAGTEEPKTANRALGALLRQPGDSREAILRAIGWVRLELETHALPRLIEVLDLQQDDSHTHDALVDLLYADEYVYLSAMVRLVVNFDPQRHDFCTWFARCARTDNTVGVPSRIRESRREIFKTNHKGEVVYEQTSMNALFAEFGDEVALCPGGHPQEWDFDPAQQEIPLELDAEARLSQLAQEWGESDGNLDRTGEARAARVKVYQATIRMLTENIATHRPVRYPKGALRVEPYQRKALERLSGYSTPVVREWLRDLDSHLKNVNDLSLFNEEVPS